MNRELLDFLGKSVAKPAASTSRNEARMWFMIHPLTSHDRAESQSTDVPFQILLPVNFLARLHRRYTEPRHRRQRSWPG